MIAFYQLGYGIAAFGVGPLVRQRCRAVDHLCSLRGAHRRGDGCVVLCSVARRRPSPATVRPSPVTRDVRPVSPTAPSGRTVRATPSATSARSLTEVGATLRSYAARGRELLDTFAADQMVTTAAASCCSPGRTGSTAAATRSPGPDVSVAAHRARRGATRSTASPAG